MAAEFKLSQPRVAKTVERVFLWMSETAPCGFAEVPRPQRLYAVARTYKQKLEWYPPTPPGYYRFKDVCRPRMMARDPIDWTKVRPGQRVKPPRYYQLSEDGTEWWPVS